MTKQEKIIEAYGEYWKDFHQVGKSSALKHNGWIGSIIEHAPKGLELDFYKLAFRPKVKLILDGISGNYLYFFGRRIGKRFTFPRF